MGKGLPRSLKHAEDSAIVKMEIDVSVDVPVASVGATAGFGTIPLGILPAGNILFISGAAQLSFEADGSGNVGEDWSGNWALGSEATDDNVMDGDEENIFANQDTTDTGTGLGYATTYLIGETNYLDSQINIIDNTGDDTNLNLNMLIDNGSIGTDVSDTITVTGRITLAYMVM